MAEGKPGTFQSEGDINLAPERRDWGEAHIDAETRALLDEDERYFFRQSLSTPCLNALQGAIGSHLIALVRLYKALGGGWAVDEPPQG